MLLQKTVNGLRHQNFLFPKFPTYCLIVPIGNFANRMILFCSPDYSPIKRVPNNSVNLLGLLKSPRGIYLLIPIQGYNKVLKTNCCNLRFQVFIQRKNVTPSFGPIAKLCSYTMVLLAPRIIFTPSNYASFATIGSLHCPVCNALVQT